jgi:hypothetical protein
MSMKVQLYQRPGGMFAAVQQFSETAFYAVNDFVTYGKGLYVANGDISPATFNPAQWTNITGSGEDFEPSTTLPLMDGVAAIGVADDFSRGDHVHPSDTSRYPVSNPAGYVNAAGASAAAPVQSVAGKTGAVTLVHTDITDWAASVPPVYVLPTASTTVLGGVKVDGTTVTIAGGVISAVATGSAGVSSFNTRTGAVVLSSGDVTAALGFTPYNTANPAGYQTAAQVTASLAPYALTSAVPVASSTAPAMDGTAAAGSATAWARGDHVHPVDTSRYAASNPSGYVTSAGAASAAPVQSVATRTGAVTLTHTDITDWTATLAPYALTANVPAASSTTPVMDGTAAIGVGTTWARADHVHPSDTSRYAANNPSGYQTAAQVTASLTAYLALAGGTMVGTLTLGPVAAGASQGSEYIVFNSTSAGSVTQSAKLQEDSAGNFWHYSGVTNGLVVLADSAGTVAAAFAPNGSSVGSNFTPRVDNTYGLGSPAFRWLNIAAVTATFSGAVTFAAPPLLPAYTIATLPAASAALKGARAYVTNGATSPTYLGALGTAASTICPVFCNGSAWVYG